VTLFFFEGSIGCSNLGEVPSKGICRALCDSDRSHHLKSIYLVSGPSSTSNSCRRAKSQAKCHLSGSLTVGTLS
jgi:hypothetical protein